MIVLVNRRDSHKSDFDVFLEKMCQDFSKTKMPVALISTKHGDDFSSFLYSENILNTQRDKHYNFGWSTKDPDELKVFLKNFKRANREYKNIFAFIHFCESEVQEIAITSGVLLKERLDNKVKFYIAEQQQ